MRRRLSLIAIAVGVSRAQPQSAEIPEYGPAKGTLVIVGGGNLTSSGINEKSISTSTCATAGTS